jgi:hypothetical protein
MLLKKKGNTRFTFKIITLNCLRIYYDLEEYLAIIIMIEGTINYSKYRNDFYIPVNIMCLICTYNLFHLHSRFF